MSPAKLMNSFIRHHNRPAHQRQWIKNTFAIMVRVARRNRQFSMDDIWIEIDKAYANGTLTEGVVDHRILGPMLRHMVNEDLISPSNYYVKSIRTGGGSRPIMIWDSNIYSQARIAA